MAKRTDANQREIVGALRFMGATVFCTHEVGRGFPDLVVGCQGQTYLVEIKSENGKLTEHQVDFIERWRGGTVHVIRDVDDALRMIGLLA